MLLTNKEYRKLICSKCYHINKVQIFPRDENQVCENCEIKLNTCGYYGKLNEKGEIELIPLSEEETKKFYDEMDKISEDINKET